MTDTVVAPFGTWPSPITAAMVARAGVSLMEPALEGGRAYWIEARPLEQGRHVVVRGDPFSEPVDVTPEGFNARTRVHEYGGGSYWLHGAAVFFTNFEDQRLYRQEGPGAEPRPVTPESGAKLRYADGREVPGADLLVCVRERHEADVVANEIVALPADGSSDAWVLAGGRDFFSFPRPSPDGRLLAWTCWDHPDMPWDATELWVAELGADGGSSHPRRVAGGRRESVQQPAWSPDGVLHFVSDRTGWWNLYRLEHLEADAGGDATPLHPAEEEFGGPQWVFGMSAYAFLEDGRIACVHGVDGEQRLGLLDPGSGEMLDLDVPYTSFPSMEVHAEGSQLVFIGAGPATPNEVVSVDFTSRSVDVLRRGRDPEVGEEWFPAPRAVEFPTDEGRTAHAWFYAPANPDVQAPEGELPPLIVVSHGGPTGNASPELDMETRFWTSRGFAVVDVDYGGSTGYGRAYRERLRGLWGILDVHDCISAAEFLADRGEVDRGRMAIRGGSAGGYTTLCALTFHAGAFAAGASYFGVGDAEALARDTHKFESRYLDGLIGPYPEEADLYRARSPVRFTELLATPVILFQGLEDEVVPPSQAEQMVAALAAKGIPHAYVTFEGEQHGFRKAENIQRSLEAELSFYAQIFGFEPSGDVERIPIANLS